MLDRTGLDALLIATQPSNHLACAHQGLAAGLPVLVEKPGAMTLDEARQLAQAAEDSGRLVWIGFNRRFRQAYQAVRRNLALAGPGSIRFELEISPNDWDPVSGYYDDPSAGGDVLHNIVSHQMDLLPWMCGRKALKLRVNSWTSNGSNLETINYEVKFDGEWVANCIARHGEAYREFVSIEMSDQRQLVYPTGLLTSRRGGWRSLYYLAGMRNWTERKLIRAGLFQDELAASYHGQLEAFGRAIRAVDTEMWACDAAGSVLTHKSMRALVRARNSAGLWHSA
jgi:predicted dehydrogenase